MPRKYENHAIGATFRCPRCADPLPIRDLKPTGRVSCECGFSIDLPVRFGKEGRATVTLITRADPPCPLCEEALAVLRREVARCRTTPDLEIVTLDSDPDLTSLFAEHIPVVFVEGSFRFRGEVVPQLLRRLLVRP